MSVFDKDFLIKAGDIERKWKIHEYALDTIYITYRMNYVNLHLICLDADWEHKFIQALNKLETRCG